MSMSRPSPTLRRPSRWRTVPQPRDPRCRWVIRCCGRLPFLYPPGGCIGHVMAEYAWDGSNGRSRAALLARTAHRLDIRPLRSRYTHTTGTRQCLTSLAQQSDEPIRTGDTPSMTSITAPPQNRAPMELPHMRRSRHARGSGVTGPGRSANAPQNTTCPNEQYRVACGTRRSSRPRRSRTLVHIGDQSGMMASVSVRGDVRFRQGP